MSRVEPQHTVVGKLIEILEGAKLLLGDLGRRVGDAQRIVQTSRGAPARDLERNLATNDDHADHADPSQPVQQQRAILAGTAGSIHDHAAGTAQLEQRVAAEVLVGRPCEPSAVVFGARRFVLVDSGQSLAHDVGAHDRHLRAS